MEASSGDEACRSSVRPEKTSEKQVAPSDDCAEMPLRWKTSEIGPAREGEAEMSREKGGGGGEVEER